MPNPKTITTYLMDGLPDGRLVCELSNWTGVAMKIPRNMLKASGTREELSRPGVYFLFGKDLNKSEEFLTYIGEAEDVYKRLIRQLEMEFWTEAISFVSTGKGLNKAQIKYLENSLHDFAKKVGRYPLKNAITPAVAGLARPEQAAMDEFIENLKVLISTLGYKIFEPLTRSEDKAAKYYFIKGARGANAKALVTNEGIVVVKGSEISISTVPSIPVPIKALRDSLVEKGIIMQQGDSSCFSRDYLFSSPSSAAAVVIGGSANGRKEWKDKDGKSLKETEEQ